MAARKIQTARIWKRVRNIAITVVALLVLAIGGGVGYTWYMGQQAVPAAPVSASIETAPTAPAPKHVQPAANAPASAAIQMLSSPVAPGSNASIDVKTNPGADCTISVLYNKVASTDSGLSHKVADDYGLISWTWTIEKTVPLGKWPVKVTCIHNKLSAVVQGDIVVAKSDN